MSIRKSAFLVYAAALSFLILSVVLSLFIGRAGLSSGQILKLFFPGSPIDDRAWSIVMTVRLPRIIFASLTGGALSVAGAVFQVLLRNDLADPYILGVSSGSALGAILAFTTGLAGWYAASVPVLAFCGAIFAITLLLILSKGRGRVDGTHFILTGVMLGAFLSALVLGQLSVTPTHMQDALFWIVGYLGGATSSVLHFLVPVVLLLVFALVLLSPAMNVLALGTEAAQSLGVNTSRVTRLLYVLGSLLTALVVSYAGTIGFIGFLIPHLVRRVIGPDHRVLLPVSFLTGAGFLTACDTASRTLFYPSEIPVGAFTAVIGVPVFLLLLRVHSR